MSDNEKTEHFWSIERYRKNLKSFLEKKDEMSPEMETLYRNLLNFEHAIYSPIWAEEKKEAERIKKLEKEKMEMLHKEKKIALKEAKVVISNKNNADLSRINNEYWDQPVAVGNGNVLSRYAEERIVFVCHEIGCNRVYTTRNGLIYHMRIGCKLEKESEKPFNCTIVGCKKKFKNNNGLKYHLLHGHSDHNY